MAESQAGYSSQPGTSRQAGTSSQASTSSQAGTSRQSGTNSQPGTSSQVKSSSQASTSIQASAASRIRPPLLPRDTAKSIYHQEVENACDVKPLIKEMERCFETSESEEESDSDESESAPKPSTSSAPPSVATKKNKKKKKKKRKRRGEDRIVHGVMTTKEDRRKAKLRHFNFSTMDPERQWLRDVLLTSTESSSDEDTPEAKDRRIKEMLKERRIYLKYQMKFNKDNPKHQHMYYSSGLLSAVDHYPEYRARRPAPPPRPPRGRAKGRSNERKKTERARNIPEKEKGKAVVKAKPVVEKPARAVRTRRGCAKDPPPPKPVTEPLTVSVDTSDAMTLEWEEHLQSMTLPALTDTEDEYMPPIATGPTSRPGTSQGLNRNRPIKKVDSSSAEAMAAKRRRHWMLIAKKEVVKLHRSRQAAHKEALVQRKRLANMCSKHVRTAAMQSQRNTKETPWRCKRLNREMQNYWRRYDRAEKETRKRMEKEAEEQRKMDVELIEAKRQRRKLNFLITQTELYAHFMQRKALTDCDNDADSILHQLDEEDDPRLTGIDPYDSASMKAKASQNAREAFRAERARAQQFDAHTGVSAEEEVDVEGEEETRRGGDFDQPAIFAGVLKGYQLKGMNWLANLYDQGISGILADEMGLGKTVQCIAFLCHVAERLGVWGPFLVVSPASTLHNWQQEMERFAPDFKVVPYWGSPSERKILRQFWSRKDLHTRSAAFHVVITSYQIVVSDLKYLNRVSWQYMILDEAQAIKSTQSIRWKLLLGFSCRNRLLLSGTPIQNSMAELWALLHFIMPTLFDSHEEFNEWFSKDIESHAENKSTIDEKHLSRLHMILKPFMLRRIKKDVENELSDKIEIMVHCPLTIRQKLLYIALKKKIKIDELLHYSVGAESGHNVDKNFTCNLMNLVMQFRKVCNHPELFERRDVRSPFTMHVDDYHVPKLIADHGILVRAIPSKRHLLYNKLSVLTPCYINESLKEGNAVGNKGLMNSCGLFAFTRLTNLSPMEVYGVALCGLSYAMRHIEASMDKYERVRHRINWWFKMYESKGKSKSAVPTKHYDRVRVKDMLYICPDGHTLSQKKEDGIVWKELLFTDPVWVQGGPFFTHADHTLYDVPETIEHRSMRYKRDQATSKDGDLEWLEMVEDESGEILSIHPETPKEFHHVERPPIVLPMMPTPVLKFLFTAQPKVSAETRAPFAVSRAFAYHVTRHQHAEDAGGAALLARLVAASRPARGWVSVQVPDKNQLVSDAGKLTVLDSLLKKLKGSGHRVLIYSQMTKMIDLLEEYMCYRKHKYMRLDGSSKISARRDMVADFQARTDIFVFLLSTRAGGLGINLTAADTVIFYDSDWNPTVDQQAMDRAHRLGQTKQVTVYRLICKGTIEERIMQRAREKSEIQRIVISGGNFKPDTLKPKEVVSLLLDDEEIELKYRQKSEEKTREEGERKKTYLLPSVSQPSCSTVSRSSHFQPSISSIPAPKPWGPDSPLLEDDDSGGSTLVVDVPPPLSPTPIYTPPCRGIVRGARGSKRGRPRGSRCVGTRRMDEHTPDNATAVAAGAALLESDAPLETLDTPAMEHLRGRRGPGRPRTRAPAPRSALRRPRRPREPLLVPLAPPP